MEYLIGAYIGGSFIAGLLSIMLNPRSSFWTHCFIIFLWPALILAFLIDLLLGIIRG